VEVAAAVDIQELKRVPQTAVAVVVEAADIVAVDTVGVVEEQPVAEKRWQSRPSSCHRDCHRRWVPMLLVPTTTQRDQKDLLQVLAELQQELPWRWHQRDFRNRP
jgi:hypothetical protein